ncbi:MULTISPECIES: tetratricopeptide repeat protein [unclassified Synechococcus]|uniref:tetratricopeptide repeat protein n=1 Tax=unclassified Synechococcus TaxID=2626047 RepID=UPI001C230EA2|nr:MULTISPECIES: tetratricopeptide repeat protein [unclassified Synechococcus]
MAPANPASLSVLADTLGNLVRVYRELGRPSEALLYCLEAIQIHCRLAGTDPAMQSRLGDALHQLGRIHKEMGQPSDALPAQIEAFAIYRRLSAVSSVNIDGLAWISLHDPHRQ